MPLTGLYLISFILVSSLTWGLAFFVWQRSMPGAKPLGVLMITLGTWSFFYVNELLSPDLSSALPWINLQYIDIYSIPVLWFIFVLAYTRRGRWLTHRNIILLAIIPVAGVFLSWTDPYYHHLMRGVITVSTLGDLLIVNYSRGPAFWVLASYSYVLLILSFIMLAIGIYRQKYIVRVQRVILLAALLLPWVSNALHILKIDPLPGIDPTVISFSFTGLVIALGLMRYQILELMPMARDKLMDYLNEIVVVVDATNRIANINKSAERLLRVPIASVLDKPFNDVFALIFPDHLEIFEIDQDEDYRAQIILAGTAGEKYAYDVIISRLKDVSGLMVGRLIVLSDVTAHLRVEEVLRQSNEELERRVRERTAELLASEERYALAARGTNDGIWDWDILNDRIYFSPRWKSMFGYSDHEMGFHLEDWFMRIHPDDMERVRTELNAHLQNDVADFNSEHRLLHRDGGFRWVLARGLAIRDEQGTPYRIAGSFSDITNRKYIEEQLLHDALHDALTGLPNRVLMHDRLTHACQRSDRFTDYNFALFYIDLDNFKTINDSLGHEFGDKVIIECARRLQGCVRDIDTVVRFGGDEFVILIEGLEDDIVYRVVERIQAEIRAPINLESRTIFITASIGIRINQPGQDSVEDILRDADIAMYRGKISGKSRYVIFDVSMRNDVIARIELENDLRRALELPEAESELFLNYQPIVSMEDGRVTGFEALVRWRHPQQGFISPLVFIPIAEEIGLVSKLGRWVLEEACRQTKAWNTAFPSDPLRTVNVNFSARQFTEEDILHITQVLHATGLSPDCLKLEITESVLIEDPGTVSRMLEQLRSLGVQLQIDDFGTGYSSLSYLHRLPIDALKIDRSFISGLVNPGGETTVSEVVRTILALAWELKIKVVAEGVETREQYDWLKGMGCNYAQGFYIAKPLDPVGVEDFLHQANRMDLHI